MANTTTATVVAEQMTADVPAEEIASIEALYAALSGTDWSSQFMLDLEALDAAKNVSREVSYGVTLMPPAAFDKKQDAYFVTITNTADGDRKTTYMVRRASIFGPGADYYLDDNLGRGHIGISESGKVILFHERQKDSVLHRIERLPIYRLKAVRAIAESELDAA